MTMQTSYEVATFLPPHSLFWRICAILLEAHQSFHCDCNCILVVLDRADFAGEMSLLSRIKLFVTIGIWDYVLSVCDWVCVHNFKPEVFLFESTSALNLSCPKISQRYLSGSPMCLASHGKIDVMLMRTLTKTFLARKQNNPGLKMRGSEIGDWTFWNLKLFQDAYWERQGWSGGMLTCTCKIVWV